MPQMTFLDGSGDTTITWNEDVDTEMRTAIENLMKKGYVFFIVDSANDGAVELRSNVKNIDELTRRSVVVEEPTLRELFNNGSIRTTKRETSSANLAAKGVARTVDQVANNNTFVTQKAVGG